jgi:hypothetical protein
MAARDAVKRVPEITRNHCPNPAKCAVDAPLTLLLCIRSFFEAIRFASDQDGKSRVLCLVSSSALWGHAPRQTDKTPIGRWSISSSLADSVVPSITSS